MTRRKQGDDGEGPGALVGLYRDGWRTGILEGFDACLRLLGDHPEAAAIIRAEKRRRFGTGQ